MDEGNIVRLKVSPAAAIRNGAATAQWLGPSQVFGDRGAWVLRDGDPKAAIVRIWRRKSVEDSTDLQIYAMDGAKACSIAIVEARMAKANETAFEKAEQALSRLCTEK
jgi:hypothetical protein